MVTDEEYETAVFRMYDCVRESGAAVSEPQRSADGQLGFFFEADDLETSPVDARHQECEALHYRAVATAWVLQREATLPPQQNILYCLIGPEVDSTTPEQVGQALDLLTDEGFDSCT